MDSSAKVVGARIREARERCGLSATLLAERLGISPQQLSDYERGAASVPKASRLAKIAKATGANIYWLMGEQDHEPQPVPRPVSQDQVVEAALAAFSAALGLVDARDRETIEQHLRTQMRILVEWALSRAPHGQVGQASRRPPRKEISPPARRFLRRRASPRGGVRAT